MTNLKALPRFQELCLCYDFKPTYLCTHEVFSDQAAVKNLKSWQDTGLAEVGAHLHPWTNPPYLKDETPMPLYHRFPCDLDDDILEEKLKSLTQVIKKSMGRSPVSYRAGRWGLDGRQLELLEKLGYRVDSSVTPRISWQNTMGDPDGVGGPDFRLAPNSLYHPSYADPAKKGKAKILEVPMSVLFVRKLMPKSRRLQRVFLTMPEGRLKRVANKTLFGQTWLRIFNTTKPKDFVRLLAAARRKKLPYLQFMTHSSELAIGTSPYVKSEAGLKHMFDMLEVMLKFFRDEGLKAAMLSEMVK